jgi:hypothetical protein
VAGYAEPEAIYPAAAAQRMDGIELGTQRATKWISTGGNPPIATVNFTIFSMA